MNIIRGLLKRIGPERKATRTVLVTLDALGTIYKFREPVAVQYLKIARNCGLKADIQLDNLDKAFRASFKHYNKARPNYGRGALDDPEAWWTGVVNRAFGKLVPGGEAAIPESLGPALYKHFSSGAAYEPFPDVRPFLQSMAALKKQCTDHNGPLVVTGVVTNSDPRVRMVLNAMGFRLGINKMPEASDVQQAVREQMEDPESAGRGIKSVFNDLYRIDTDFDIVLTSYDADAEKPDPRIWTAVDRLTVPLMYSRAEQAVHAQYIDSNEVSNTRLMLGVVKVASRMAPDSSPLLIHIGDEYSKDYVGAEAAGWDALHLARDDESLKGLGRDVQVVRSLDEAGMVVNLMAQEFLSRAKGDDNS